MKRKDFLDNYSFSYSLKIMPNEVNKVREQKAALNKTEFRGRKHSRQEREAGI